MPIAYPDVLELTEAGRSFSYTKKDAMLYALALGFGSDPLAEDELGYVYEKGLKSVPTLATVVAWGAGVSTERLGLKDRLVLHGEEDVTFHRPLPVAADIVADSRVLEVQDKGPAKGAVIIRETVLRVAGDSAPLVTIRRSAFAPKDGGFGGPAGESTSAPPPKRSPDHIVSLATRPDQALLYRLCGDRNPLHADPKVARASGFERPILHGLCTFGLTCRAVLMAYGLDAPERVLRHAARFSAPVYPGETLLVSLWRDGDEVAIEASVDERNAKVIRNGRTWFSSTPSD